MTVSSLGIGSGIDLQGILDGLMNVEKTQQNLLKTKVTANQGKISTYQALNSQFLSLKTASEALNLGSAWKAFTASSSDASVTASASSNAISGNFSFKVTSLAAAHVMASSGTVSGLNATVGSGGVQTVGSLAALGATSYTTSGLANGDHVIEATQASGAASIDGGTIPPPSQTLGTRSINLSVNGANQSLTIPSGTYSPQGLVDVLNNQSVNPNKGIVASLDTDGSIKLSTTREGSAASLRVVSGNGLSVIGHTATPTAVTGTNGIVTVDGVSNIVTNTDSPTVLNSSAGSITATWGSGGVTVGSSKLSQADYGSGSLADVVNGINAAKGDMTAAAIQVSPGQYKLQLTASQTGVANALTIDPNAYSSTLGTLQTVTAAADAVLQVGDGAGAYSITSPSNTIKDALPGVTLNLNSADPTKTVNVKVNGDVNKLADMVETMVKAANSALGYIRDNSKYNPDSSTAGSLLGNSVASRLSQQLFSQILNPVGGTSLTSVDKVGIKTDSTGAISFDKEKFKAAYAADSEGVAAMFVEGGTRGVASPSVPGIAERLANLAKSATSSTDGTITLAIKGLNTTITDLNDQIDKWDTRLAQRQATLKRQFSALDVAISNYQSMGSWLSGQISKLG